MSTKVSLIRKGGKGIVGTVENAEHHANYILPFIEAMRGAVMHLGFKEWKMGSNVHEFIAGHGARYTLRPICQDSDKSKPYYCGIRLSLRLSRSEEHRLIEIDSVADVPRLLDVMRLLAMPIKGRLNTGAEAKEAA
jgi:hypothetical protein